MSVSAGHVAAAALAGGLVGLLAGVLGQPIHEIASEVVIVATLLAVVSAARGNRRGYGRRRQVPRGWIGKYGARRAYAAWSALLGSGVATIDPHSAYLVLLAAELVSGRRRERSRAPRSGSPAGWRLWSSPAAEDRPRRLPTSCRGPGLLLPAGIWPWRPWAAWPCWQ